MRACTTRRPRASSRRWTRIKDERGAYNLDHVPEMPVDEAMAYLTSFPGVGHKTASIVLLFIFDMPAFPVDTHIQRISQRTGISSRRATPEKVKADWEALLPGETYFPLAYQPDQPRARPLSRPQAQL